MKDDSRLDVQVNDALAKLNRLRAVKRFSVVTVVLAVAVLLFGLTAIMYQEPVEVPPASHSPGDAP